MREVHSYKEFPHRWYWPRVSTYWWLYQRSYMKFILREISSVFVAFFVVITLLQIRAVARGPEAWAGFQEWLKTPGLVALNVVTLFFVVFHAVTWFNAAPRAMVVRVGGKRVPDFWIAASNYAAWVAASAVVAWIVLGG